MFSDAEFDHIQQRDLNVCGTLPGDKHSSDAFNMWQLHSQQEINGKQKSKWMLTFSLIHYKIPIIHVWNPKACFFFHYFITKIPIIIHVWNLKSRVTFSWAYYKDSESQLYVVFFLLRHCITLHRIITNHIFHWEYWR